MKKFFFYFFFTILFLLFIYFGSGFYLAHKILRIDHSCGKHEGSLPNTWTTKVGYENLNDEKRIKLRKNFNEKKYYLHKWEDVNFPSRESEVNISGWLFDYHLNKPIIIIIHGIFPNGKCNPEPNIIASMLIKNGINALTIDLRNYGKSSKVSHYENL